LDATVDIHVNDIVLNTESSLADANDQLAIWFHSVIINALGRGIDEKAV